MSAFAGSLFKRDVALVEESIQKDDYNPLAAPIESAVSFLTFTNAGGETIPSSNVAVTSIQLQGQSVDDNEEVFHVTQQDGEIGKYIVALSIGGNATQIELPVGDATANVDLDITHKLGKQRVHSLPASEEVAFTLATVNYKCSVPAVTNLDLFVEFDKIGKPDMTWHVVNFGYTSPSATFTYNVYIAKTNKDASIGIAVGATATDVKTFNNVEISKLTFNGSYSAVNKNITVTSVDVHLDKLNFNDGTNVKHALVNQDLTITLAASPVVTIPVKEANTDGRLAVKLSSDVSFAANANVTIGGFTCNSLVLTLSEHCPEFFVAGSDVVGWVAEVQLFGYFSSANNVEALYLVPKQFNFEEVIHFKDGANEHNDIVTITPGATFYEKFLEPGYGNVLNVSHDAGFLIPVQQDEYQMEQKYVRISDIYNKLNSKEQVEVPKLADRLHALEVALTYESSDVLDSTDPEAVRLQALKDQYSALDISNL